MADDEAPKEFPDVGQKLSAPKKLSAFERERQAAEAKRQRAEAENAAALKAFEDSFADDAGDQASRSTAGGRGAPIGPRWTEPVHGSHSGRLGGPSPPQRSGPGSLGVAPGGPPPPPSMKRKRALDELREQQEALREQDLLDVPRDETQPNTGRQHQEHGSDENDDAPKPTVQLSALPPNMSSEDVKIMLRDHVQVHSVTMLQAGRLGPNGRRSSTAIATLASEVSTSQIDSAVSALKGLYLGWGFYLSISRHLSSTALHPSLVSNNAALTTEPFGAEMAADPQGRFSLRAAPPPRDHRGFAPPQSYETPSRASYASSSSTGPSVCVRPPSDLSTIKAIHVIAEHLLLCSDPQSALEAEAMLMALPEVQQDERFAFLYDSRSPAGIYYRYCLWAPEHLDDDVREQKRRLCAPERVFDDVAIDWLPPHTEVLFPDLTSLSQVVTDMDYVSSDEESDDEVGERKFNTGREAETSAEGSGKRHLTPLQYARLVHLLSRLPTSNARLRKGDIARVTNFAITHAGQGAEDIVGTLLLNVEKPFSFSIAAKYEADQADQDDGDVYEPGEELSDMPAPARFSAPLQPQEVKREDDPSNARLIALYAISDILSASSTAGAKNAWKYRQLFESGFKIQQTFESLGKLDKELVWGRMKAEQWKRKILAVFSIWEGWAAFPTEVHEELKHNFLEPPLTAAEKAEMELERVRAERGEEDENRANVTNGNAKSVAGRDSSSLPTTSDPATAPSVPGVLELGRHPGGTYAAVAQAQHMPSKIESRPPSTELGVTPATESGTAKRLGQTLPSSSRSGTDRAPGPKRRMRAEDIFADSDGE